MSFEKIVRVLLVDDDEDDYVVFKSHLQKVGADQFELEWAPSYDRGISAILTGAFDVCFLDYRLGIKTGLDFLREALAQNVTTPMILLTGYGEREVDLESMKTGAADYLVKDQVTPAMIDRSIRYAIHRTRATQAILEREIQILMQDRLASVGLLASSLAHEIGTPLGVIRGRAEYLGTQVPESPLVQKNVEVIVSQIDRVSKLIRSLLNLARGDQVSHAGQIQVNQVSGEVVELLAHEFRKHQIELRDQLSKDVQISVHGESGPIHQVFLNLLINSIHAIESAIKGGRKTGHFIRISAEKSNSNWVIHVEDSGCGMSQAHLKNLFRPFFTTKDIGVGTGLGLATSYRIMESYGGAIHADSIEGQGTIFHLRLPQANGAS